MSFLVISDVHAAFPALARVADSDLPILILGDLVNLIDYRTIEGIVPDVVGRETVEELARLRQHGLHDEARALWFGTVSSLGIDVGAEIRRRMIQQYEAMARALDGARAYVTFGNADDPELLRKHLPDTSRFVDGEVVDIDGIRVGFAGGGIARIGAVGEVSDAAMADKLGRLGPVDVLCTHVPPALPMPAEDAIAGTTKGSGPVLAYIDEHKPAHHFYGDVHQPRAVRWQRGSTVGRNVGYFRATGRAWRHVADSSTSGDR